MSTSHGTEDLLSLNAYRTKPGGEQVEVNGVIVERPER